MAFSLSQKPTDLSLISLQSSPAFFEISVIADPGYFSFKDGLTSCNHNMYAESGFFGALGSFLALLPFPALDDEVASS